MDARNTLNDQELKSVEETFIKNSSNWAEILLKAVVDPNEEVSLDGTFFHFPLLFALADGKGSARFLVMERDQWIATAVGLYQDHYAHGWRGDNVLGSFKATPLDSTHVLIEATGSRRMPSGDLVGNYHGLYAYKKFEGEWRQYALFDLSDKRLPGADALTSWFRAMLG